MVLFNSFCGKAEAVAVPPALRLTGLDSKPVMTVAMVAGIHGGSSRRV